MEAERLATARILTELSSAFYTEGEEKAMTYVATFSNLLESLDPAVQLINEVVNLPNVRVTINSRPVINLTKFLSALICYRDSLCEDEPRAYCGRQADRLGKAAGCPMWTCHLRCQFICPRCCEVIRESGALSVADQLRDLAVNAEVEWCPNLQFGEVVSC